MSKNRIKVESKDLDGNDVVLYANRPNRQELEQAQLVSNRTFKDALLNGAMVRRALMDQLETQGIWTIEKDDKLEEYNKEIRDHLVAIKGGNIKLSDARDHAIKVRIARMEMIRLQAEKNEYDAFTAEAQAESAKIDYLTSVCLKNEKGEPYFKSMEEYIENSNQPFVIQASNKLATLVYGVDEKWENDLPENKFLQKYGFVDEDLRLVKDGHYVTVDGKAINEDFEYINENGEVIDAEGNLLDEDGLPVVESAPFLDDDGNPIVEPASEEVED
jgi:hypothetical protein